MVPLLAVLVVLSVGGWLRAWARGAAAERRLAVLQSRHAIVTAALGEAREVLDRCAHCRRLAREAAVERHAAARFEREAAALPAVDWRAPVGEHHVAR
jgi:hypothetical protein